MSCSCLPIFGKKKQPRSPAADSAPASDARTPAPGGQKPPSREQGAAQAAQDATSLSGLWEEVPSTRGAHDASVVGMGRTGKTGAREGISPSDVNGRFDAQVPDWVQKAAVPGAAGEQERIGVMGEVGSIHHGSGDGFQTRATPRSVFRKAEQNSGRCGGGEDGGVPAGRPPRPPAVSGGSDAAGVSVSDWVQVVDARKESQVFAARNMTASLMQGLDGLPDHRNGLLDHRAHAAAEGEVLVRDSDPQCIPGAEVQVSKRWQDVPYFKQFHGVGGKLTRRGVNGATWYAAFTGCPEQAFSTGMHGQYILCYAPARAQEAKVESLGYATAEHDATGINEAKNAEDSVADSRVALATDARLAAPRGGKRPPSARGVPAANAGVVGGTNSTSNGLAPLVSTLPPSARGPLISARGQLSGRIKERPPSARSRLAMGAPPLASARSGRLSTRRHNTQEAQEDGAVRPLISNRGPGAPGRGAGHAAGSGDVPMSPRDDDTPESPRDGGRDGRLFKFPEWDEYELFDSDDLWSEHAYLLYGEPLTAGNQPAVFVWIGQYFEECAYSDDAACDTFAMHAVEDFKATFGGNVPMGTVTVVKELEEEEDFWEYFVLG